MESLLSIFKNECPDLKVDQGLIQRVGRYQRAFVIKNEEHADFFGGNLLGVHRIRFTDPDRYAWFDEVLGIDDLVIRDQVIKLPTIDAKWKRVTDVFNLSCIYVVYLAYNTPDLSATERVKFCTDALMILHYKFMTSLQTHYYPYPADRSLAMATYASLSKKFAIKVAGSWAVFFESRAKDIINERSIHNTAMHKFTPDAKVIYMITDIQGRLRDVVKGITEAFHKLKESGDRIKSTSDFMEIDGEILLRDKTRKHIAMKKYLHEVASKPGSLIKDDLVTIIVNLMKTVPQRALEESLTYVTVNYPYTKDIPELIDETLLHAIDFMTSERSSGLRDNDLAAILQRLKALYMSSRTSDPSILKMRKLASHIAREATGSRNEALISSTRNSILLYFVLRGLTMSHFN